jgi:hypothetical protein
MSTARPLPIRLGLERISQALESRDAVADIYTALAEIGEQLTRIANVMETDSEDRREREIREKQLAANRAYWEQRRAEGQG